jgi:hypothetical protein
MITGVYSRVEYYLIAYWIIHSDSIDLLVWWVAEKLAAQVLGYKNI